MPIVALFAAVLAVLGDLLVHDSITGAGFAVWIALIAISFVALQWRAGLTVRREARAWLATAVLFAVAAAWRDSETLQFFDVCAVLGALCMTALATNDPGLGLFARRLRDTLRGVWTTSRLTVIGIVPLAFTDAKASGPRSWLGERARRWARGAIIVLPLLFVFGALLRGADPIFASLADKVMIDPGAAAPHIALTVVFSCILAGWARAALLPAGEPRARSGRQPLLELMSSRSTRPSARSTCSSLRSC